MAKRRKQAGNGVSTLGGWNFKTSGRRATDGRLHSNDDTRLETAEFASAELTTHPPDPAARQVLSSLLEFANLASLHRRAVLDAATHIAVPNCHRTAASWRW